MKPEDIFGGKKGAEMAKKRSEKNALLITEAVALYLVVEEEHCTQKQDIKNLLEKIKPILRNPRLTLQNMIAALKQWFDKGWATLCKEFIQVTRCGRKKIRELAEVASAPPPPQTN